MGVITNSLWVKHSQIMAVPVAICDLKWKKKVTMVVNVCVCAAWEGNE